jgi:hypothetical protein
VGRYALILKASPDNGAVNDRCERTLGDGSIDVFQYPDGTYLFDFIARMPPDGWAKMNKCVALRNEMKEDKEEVSNDAFIIDADTDHNLAITHDEFKAFCNAASSSLEEEGEALSTRLFAALDREGVGEESVGLGRSLRGDGVIHVGYAWKRNAGWLERQSGLSYPWMETVVDSIPLEVKTLLALYQPENLLVQDICRASPASSSSSSKHRTTLSLAKLAEFEDASFFALEELSAVLSTCKASPPMNAPQERYLHSSILQAECEEAFVGGAEKVRFPPSMGRTTTTRYDLSTNSMVCGYRHFHFQQYCLSVCNPTSHGTSSFSTTCFSWDFMSLPLYFSLYVTFLPFAMQGASLRSTNVRSSSCERQLRLSACTPRSGLSL